MHTSEFDALTFELAKRGTIAHAAMKSPVGRRMVALVHYASSSPNFAVELFDLDWTGETVAVKNVGVSGCTYDMTAALDLFNFECQRVL